MILLDDFLYLPLMWMGYNHSWVELLSLKQSSTTTIPSMEDGKACTLGNVEVTFVSSCGNLGR
jgi:hypothetical protein